jgi:hypothetical protein
MVAALAPSVANEEGVGCSQLGVPVLGGYEVAHRLKHLNERP